MRAWMNVMNRVFRFPGCEQGRIRPRSTQAYSGGWAFVSGPKFKLLDGPRLMWAKIAASTSTPYINHQRCLILKK